MVKSKTQRKQLRHERLRKKLKTSAERPRLSVFVSNAHLSCQIIDDINGKTLASSSTMSLKLAKPTREAAQKIGKDIAQQALKLGIKKIAFDTGGNSFGLKLKTLADAARQEGLEF
jgi:large subunit ribosomal protein L18